MRISDCSSDLCSSDLHLLGGMDMHRPCRRHGEQRREFVGRNGAERVRRDADIRVARKLPPRPIEQRGEAIDAIEKAPLSGARRRRAEIAVRVEDGEQRQPDPRRSEEHTSELQSLMRISYAVFCLKKKKKYNNLDMSEYQ